MYDVPSPLPLSLFSVSLCMSLSLSLALSCVRIYAVEKPVCMGGTHPSPKIRRVEISNYLQPPAMRVCHKREPLFGRPKFRINIREVFGTKAFKQRVRGGFNWPARAMASVTAGVVRVSKNTAAVCSLRARACSSGWMSHHTTSCVTFWAPWTWVAR